MMTRRQILDMMGAGFGIVGFRGLAGAASAVDPLTPKPVHFPAKAKRVINLFLNGGPSQVDTFDPKPMLDKYHGKPLPGGHTDMYYPLPEPTIKTGVKTMSLAVLNLVGK